MIIKKIITALKYISKAILAVPHSSGGDPYHKCNESNCGDEYEAWIINNKIKNKTWYWYRKFGTKEEAIKHMGLCKCWETEQI